VLSVNRRADDNFGKAVDFDRHCYRPDVYSFDNALVDKQRDESNSTHRRNHASPGERSLVPDLQETRQASIWVDVITAIGFHRV
jgi:hypothetical protein